MIGARISHYEILEKLGEGGMGVVYKAQDLTLDRLVALKFLPESTGHSTDTTRFVQEAKAAAALNHPNICTIHGIEEADDPSSALGTKRSFIVMEFVDGQMLEEKKASLSQKQAIEIGIQIAEGLAAAHEQGIVHRDIKPENIMIRKDGRVQIMDFGLAKLRGASRLTKEGSTVGTAGYMSPEQVQGLETDHRSDIFSLGVLLFEMLTGQAPFKGVHETAIAYEIVNVDTPPPSTVRPEITAELDAIVLECLEKDPNERAQSAKQIAIDLNRFKRASSRSRLSRTMPARTGAGVTGTASGPERRSLVRFLPWSVTAAIFLLSAGWFLFLRDATGDGASVSRWNISALTAPNQLIFHSDIPCLALSPDGRRMVYTLSDGGRSELFIRSIDNYETRPIRGTTNGTSPFFSPDGQWIGFVADGKIKKVPTAGGTVEILCDAQGFRGADWGPDDRIYYSPDFSAGLMSVSANGGTPVIFSTLDSSRGERTHRWPQVLPGGKWVLYTVGFQNSPTSYTDAVLMLQSTETGERRELDVRGEMARFVEPGYLVVGRNASILAAPFSLDDAHTTKPLSTLIEGVSGDPGSGVVDFSLSASGHLVYLPGSPLQKEYALVWVARDGKVSRIPLPPQPFNVPRLSPDGKRLAIGLGLPGSENSVWIYDLAKATFNRLTFGKSGGAPLWSRDGRSIYYAAQLPEGIMVQPADGSSQGVRILSSRFPIFPASLSRDERQLVVGGLGSSDVMVIDLDKGGELRSLIAARPYAYGGWISPDGRYIAYGSNETGTLEIFVTTYPQIAGKWQVSVGGGTSPLWSPDGQELFYVSASGKLMAASIRTTPVFSSGSPRELFDVSQMSFPNSPVSNYDVSPDGKRFIMIQKTAEGVRETSFNYVQNWQMELDQLRR